MTTTITTITTITTTLSSSTSSSITDIYNLSHTTPEPTISTIPPEITSLSNTPMIALILSIIGLVNNGILYYRLKNCKICGVKPNCITFDDDNDDENLENTDNHDNFYNGLILK